MVHAAKYAEKSGLCPLRFSLRQSLLTRARSVANMNRRNCPDP